MMCEQLGSGELVTLGVPAGRYWVSSTSAPGGFGFAQLITTEPGIQNYYSDLEIALMAEYPELFNDPNLDEDRAFSEAMLRAYRPGIIVQEPEPETSDGGGLNAQEYLLPVAAGAGLYAAAMGYTVVQPPAEAKPITVPIPVFAPYETWTESIERSRVARGTAGMAWPVAIGVLAFSLVGLQ